MLGPLVALLLLLTSPASAAGFLVASPSLTGTTLTGNGFDFTSNPALFSNTTTARQFSAPFTYTFQIRTTLPSLSANFLNIISNVPAANNAGTQITYSTTNEGGFPFQILYKPGSGTQANCTVRVCTRWTWLNDGAWHTVCSPFPASGPLPLFIDGVLRDQQPTGASYTSTTAFWNIGISNTAFQIRQFRVYGIALANSDCVRLNNYYGSNLVPTGPDVLASNILVDVPLNNCTGTAPNLTCADNADGLNPFTTDQAGPSCTITTPNSNPNTGTVSATASCTDSVAVTSAYWALDGVPISGSLTTAPFTFSIDTTKYIDGVHNLTVVGTNPAGVSGTSPAFAMTTSNSITATSYFVDPVSGSDSNNCKSSGAACLTWDHVLATYTVFRGGDSLLQKAGTSFTVNATDVALCGLAVTGCTQNWWPAGGASYKTTISTYGGSGNCQILAGVTTDCATLTMQSGSPNLTAIYLGNPANALVSNWIVVGTNTLAAQTVLSNFGIQTFSTGFSSSGVTITNNKTLDWKAGIYLQANSTQSGYTITNNFMTCTTATTACDVGLWVRFSNSNHTVQGNLVTNIGSSLLGTLNIYPGCCGNGILISDGGGLAASGLTGILDQFNVVHDGGGNNNQCGGPSGNWTFRARATIQFSESYNMKLLITYGNNACDWSGFDIDGGSNGVLIQYNYAHNNHGSGFTNFMGAVSGTAFANNATRYNVAENNNTLANTAQGVFGAGGGTNLATNSGIYNNTSYSNSTLVLEGGCLGIFSNNDMFFRNNICYQTNSNPYFIFASSVNPTSMTFDNNDYYNSASGTARTFGINGTVYSTFAAYQSATGFDPHSVTGNPTLTTPGGGGTCYTGTGVPAGPQPCPSAYVLQPSSTMIGTGAALSSPGSRDYYGNAIPNATGTGYNLGAYGGT